MENEIIKYRKHADKVNQELIAKYTKTQTDKCNGCNGTGRFSLPFGVVCCPMCNGSKVASN